MHGDQECSGSGEEREMFDSTEQRIADQARVILKEWLAVLTGTRDDR